MAVLVQLLSGMIFRTIGEEKPRRLAADCDQTMLDILEVIAITVRQEQLPPEVRLRHIRMALEGMEGWERSPTSKIPPNESCKTPADGV